MKNIIFFGLYLVAATLSAQNLSLSVMPRYSMGLAIPPSYKLIQGNEFLTTEITPSYTGTLAGSTNEVTRRSDGFGIDVYLKLANKQNNAAWGILFGGYVQKYLFIQRTPYFLYSGTIITGHHDYQRTIGTSIALRRTFANNRMVNFFAQLGIAYNLKTQYMNKNGNWTNLIPNAYSRSVESGKGIEWERSESRNTNFAIVPEIGIRNRGDWGAELSISYSHPVGPALYKEQATFYEGYRVVGVQKANRTASMLSVNLRLSLNILGGRKGSKPITIIKPIPSKSAPPVNNESYQSVCIRVLDETTRKPIANAQLSMSNNSYNTDNDGNIKLPQLICCNERTIKVTAANYKEASKTFILSYQTGCQSVEVLLAKNEISKPKFDNKEVVVGKSLVLNIQFEQSNKTILPSAKIELEKVVELLKNNPTAIITLAGHTSNEGDYNLNVQLSRERAEACKNYLIERVPNAKNRIEAKGFGSTRPIYPNTSTENRKKNRRVELTVEKF